MKRKVLALILVSACLIGGCSKKDTENETKETTAADETTEAVETEETDETTKAQDSNSVIADNDEFECQVIKDFIKEHEDDPNMIMETYTGDRAANYDSRGVGVEEILIASDFENSEKTMFIKFDTFENAKDYLGDELVGQELDKTENADGSIDYETKGDENKMYGTVYADGLMTWIMKIH